jgi:hypothetical protein
MKFTMRWALVLTKFSFRVTSCDCECILENESLKDPGSVAV